MSTIDETGMHMDNLAEIIAALEADTKSALGSDHKTEPRSVTGQILNLLAPAFEELNQFVEEVENSQNPNKALGVALSENVRLNGIKRFENLYSTGAVDCQAGPEGCEIEAGDLVKNVITNKQFSIDSAQSLGPNELRTVSCTCTEPGPNTAIPGEVTEIITKRYGWLGVNNSSIFVVGQSEEKDPALHLRRKQTVSAVVPSSVIGLWSRMMQVDGVSEVKIATHDEDSNIPTGHVWPIIRGGTDLDIAEQLIRSTGGGTGLYGSIETPWTHVESGTTYTARHNRPTDREIFLQIYLTRFKEFPTSGNADVVEAVLKFFRGEFSIDGVPQPPYALGDDVHRSRLYSPVNSVPGHRIERILVGTTVANAHDSDLTLPINEKAFVNPNGSGIEVL